MENVKSNLLQALILTKNEEPNIERVLRKLTWIDKIIILDSFSDDRTIEIVETFPNVEVVYRGFDSFAEQCNYGLSLMDSEWILSLDADYVLTDAFISETKEFVTLHNDIVAYNTAFEFLIYGKQLLSNNTTPRAVLFKKNCGTYINDGHAHRLQISGTEGRYKSKILHDDRKSLTRWVNNQNSYSLKEAHKLLDKNSPGRNSLINKIRRTKILAPFFVFFYCLFVNGLIFSGWAGWYYTLQRVMVEILFALRMIEDENLLNDSRDGK